MTPFWPLRNFAPISHRVLACLILGHVLSSCVFFDDYGKFSFANGAHDGGQDAEVDGSDEPDDASHGDADVPDAESPVDLTCVQGTLEGLAPQASGETLGSSARAGSCGGSGAPERIFEWTAPVTDYFRFHTEGSSFDPVLYLLDDDCQGAEIACHAAPLGTRKGEIVKRLGAGQRVLVVVDGHPGELGAFELAIERVTCPAAHLDETILPITHSNEGRDPYPFASCPDPGMGARTYRYVAPSTGFYSIEAVRTGGSFNPTLLVASGAACGGEALQCNGRGTRSWVGYDRRAIITRALTEGEEITIAVSGDASEGTFSLDVTPMQIETCIDAVVDESVGHSFSGRIAIPLDGPHRTTTSCGQASATDLDGTIRRQPDYNILIVPPLAPDIPGFTCKTLCSVSIVSGFQFMAAVSEADAELRCPRRELSCSPGVDNGDWQNPEFTRTIEFEGNDGRPRILTIDRILNPQGTAYFDTTELVTELDLDVACYVGCI